MVWSGEDRETAITEVPMKADKCSLFADIICATLKVSMEKCRWVDLNLGAAVTPDLQFSHAPAYQLGWRKWRWCGISSP